MLLWRLYLCRLEPSRLMHTVYTSECELCKWFKSTVRL